MMYKGCISAAAISISVSASAQTELIISCEWHGIGQYALYAQLLNPTGTVLATVSDIGFRFAAPNLSDFTYNPIFDSDFFGPATVSMTGNAVHFRGTNTLPPLNNAGGIDSSNPLLLATYSASSPAGYFTFEGQVTGAYTGVPFPIVLFYQNADGSAGDTPYRTIHFPTPATTSLLVMGGFACVRRSR